MARRIIEWKLRNRLRFKQSWQWLDRKDASLHIEQQPGNRLYVDFAGSKMQKCRSSA